MKLPAFESVGELLLLFGSAIGSALLTAVGVVAEHAGAQNVLAGNTVLGVWELFVGAAVLYFGLYLLGYHGFWHRLQRLRYAH
jgi:hypothetical protein